MEPNRLVIRLQPNEGLKLCMTSKEPGPGGMRLFPASLNLSFNETFKTRLPEAYERLLMDVARGNQTPLCGRMRLRLPGPLLIRLSTKPRSGSRKSTPQEAGARYRPLS